MLKNKNIEKENNEPASLNEFTVNIINSMTDSVIVINSKALIQKVNQSALVLLGYNADELLGETIYRILKKDKASELTNEDELINNKNISITEKVYFTKKGREIPVLLSGFALQDNNKNITGMVLIATINTKQKQLDENGNQFFSNINILSQAATKYISISSDDNIYDYIRDVLKEITKAKYIVITSFNKTNKELKIESLFAESFIVNNIQKLLGRKVVGMKLKPKDDKLFEHQYNELLSKQNLLLPENIYELAGKTIPKSITQVIEKIMNVEKVYVMGFSVGDTLYGSASILLGKGEHLWNDDIIGAFINQTSAALQRKAMDEELKESEKKYRLLAENVSDVIWKIDIETMKYTYVSPSVSRLLGYSINEILSQKITDIIPKKYHDIFKNVIPDKIIKFYKNKLTEQEKIFEIEQICKDGRIIWVEILANFISDINGKINEIIGVSRDITANRIANEEKKILAQMLDYTNVGVIVHDFNGEFIYFNQTSHKLHGYSNNEFFKLNIRNLYNSEIQDELTDRIKIIKEKGEIQFETVQLKKDRTEFPAIIFANVVQWGEQKVILCTITDITKRKNDEESLQMSEGKFRGLFENSFDAIMVIESPFWKFTSVNPASIKMFGAKSESEFTKYSPWELSPFKQPDGHISAEKASEMIDIAVQKGYNHFEWTHRRIDGIEFIADILLILIEQDGHLSIQATVRDITERKKVENDLKESEEKFALAFKTSAYAIIISDIMSGEIIDMNDGFLKITGYKNEEVNGKTILELNIWANEKDIFDVLSDLKNNIKVYNREYIFNTKSGKKIHGLFSAEKIKLSNKYYVISSINDISERKKTEKELNKLTQAVEQSSATIVITDIDGNIEYVNGKFEKLSGYSTEEAIGKNPRILKTGHTSDEEYKILWETIKSGNSWRGEFKNKKKNGDLYWESALISPIIDTNGVITNYLAIKEDITEYKIAEQALIESREQLNFTLKSSQIGIWKWDIKSNILYYDEQIAKHFGIEYSQFGISETEFLKIIHADDRIKFKNHIIDTINNEKEFILEFRIVLFDGNINYIASRGILVNDNINNPIRINGIMWDITEQKQNEEILKSSEEKFRNIFTNIQDVYYETTVNGIIIEVSPSISNVTNYSREELIGKNMNEFYADIQVRDKMLEIITKNGFINDFEIPLIDKNNIIKRCSITSKLAYDSNGKPNKLIGSMRNIEQRRIAEEEMNKALEKYKELFEASNDIIYTLDFNGNFTSVNPISEKILGYKLESLSNKNMMNFITEENYKTAFDNIEKKIKGEFATTVYEVEFKNNFGTITDLEVSSMIRYKNGQPLEVFGIARDITEKKKLSNELIRNHDVQKVLNTLLRESLDEISLENILYRALELLVSISWLALDKKGAIFMTDDDGCLRMVVSYGLNKEVMSACKIVPSGKCLCGKVLKDKKAIYSPAVDHDHEINYGGMTDHGHYCIPIIYADKVCGVINTYIAKDHKYSEFEMEFLTALANTVAGIITRKKAEQDLQLLLNSLELRINHRTEELSRSEELYQTTVNSISDWIFVIDYDYKIIFLNNSLKYFFIKNGITKELKGLLMQEILPFIDNTNINNYKQVFSEGIQLIIESEYTMFNKKYYVQSKISPIFRNNQVIRIVTTVIDITKQKEIENEILKNLKREKELNALKSQFVSTVSHEFRTPLAGILSSVQLLKLYSEKWDTEKKEKMYSQIFDAVQHTKAMLDDVSMIDKEQSNKITLHPSMIDIEDLLQKIIEDNKHVYGSNYEINTEYYLLAKQYYFDKDILRHILSNVISNAIKYSGTSRKINLNVKDYNNNLIFTIVDFGIGIPQEEQKFLFDPFYRASNVEAISGTGFGLSIVKRFIEMHSGKIEVDSNINEGTKITISLPFIAIPIE